MVKDGQRLGKGVLVMVLCPKGRAGPAAPEQPGNKEQLVFSHSINSLASLLRPQQRDNYRSGLVGEGSGPELHRQKPLLVLDWGKSGDIKIFLKIQINFFFFPKMLLANSVRTGRTPA